MPAKTFARPVRSGSASSSVASGSNRSSGTTSSIAPSRAPARSTCESASVSNGSAVSGELPDATSVTDVRKALASAAVRSAKPDRSSTSLAWPSVTGSSVMVPACRMPCGAVAPGTAAPARVPIDPAPLNRGSNPSPSIERAIRPDGSLFRSGVGVGVGAGGGRRWSGVDATAALEGSSERHLVGVLEVTTDGEAGGQPRHGEADVAQQPAQVGGRGLALEVGVGRDDDLLHLTGGEARHELAHPQIVGADAVDGADRTAEHVVGAAELARALDGDDVLGLLDDADRGVVTWRVGAD